MGQHPSATFALSIRYLLCCCYGLKTARSFAHLLSVVPSVQIIDDDVATVKGRNMADFADRRFPLLAIYEKETKCNKKKLLAPLNGELYSFGRWSV